MPTELEFQTGRPSSTSSPGAEPVKVLVAIPTLNEAEHIGAVLAHLLTERTAGLAMTIVVVDGGSTDGTPELARRVARAHDNVFVLDNPRRIQSAAVNLAVRRYGRGHTVLIRCDAHARYPEDYCARLVSTLERTRAQAVVVPLDSHGEKPFQRAVAWVCNSFLGSGGSAHRAGRRSGFVDHGHHAAFLVSSFEAAGGYDETFTHNEDAELDCRQRALGARIYLDSEIRVSYLPRSSVRALFRQYFRYGVGRSRTLRRHPASLRLRQLVAPGHVVASACAFGFGAFWPWLFAWPAFYAAVLVVLALRLSLRHRTFAGLLALPVAATLHAAWGSGFLHGLLVQRERAWSPQRTAPLWLGEPS